jgi:hypothetical protein
VILLTNDALGVWRADLRAGELLLTRTAPAPESALAALLLAYQEEAPPDFPP